MSDCCNTPTNPRQDGICHVCKTWTSVGFCPLCCHWFCATCSWDVVSRIAGALAQWFGGPTPGCCGPGGICEEEDQW